MKLVSIATAVLLSISAPSFAQEPKKPLPAQQESSLATERRELAEIQLLLGADRKYAEAKERLAKLAETLAKRADADAKALLGEVETLSRSVRRSLGEPVRLEAELAGEERAFRFDVTTRPKGDAVDEAVLAALARNDYGFLKELGTRAGPGLAQAVRDDPDTLPGESGRDALRLLLEVDPRRGDGLLYEMLEHDGFFWKKRVVRALGETELWNGGALFSTENPPRWIGEGIRQTLEKYAVDPDVGNDALFELGSLVGKGARSDVFARLLTEGLRSADSTRRATAKSVVRGHRFDPLRTILEAALDDGDADLRIFASSELCGFSEGRALLAHAGDPEPEVRRQILKRLENDDQRNWQEEEPAVLARLLVDEVSGVRKQAWEILYKLRSEKQTTELPAELCSSGKPFEVERWVYTAPLPAGVYRSLLERPEVEERARLAAIACYLPAPLCFELALALGADPAPGVPSTLEENLKRLPYWSDPDAMLRILSALLDNPARVWGRNRIDTAVTYLTATRAGLVALARWIIARNEPLANAIEWQTLADADPRLFVEYMSWLFEKELLDWNKLRTWRVPAMRLLAQDRSRPFVLRMLALESICGSGDWDEAVSAAVEEVLADPGWGTLDQGKWSGIRDDLHGLVSHVPGDARNHAISVMLDNPSFPAWLADAPAGAFDARAAGAAAIGKQILARWFAREDEDYRAVYKAIEAMASLPELRDDRVLAEATRRNGYGYSAWDTIAVLKDPAFLPLIRTALEESGERKAAEALFGYLSDEAAELLLLAAAKVQSTELRDRCLAHLEKIREYQDSRERWATRKVKTQTREQVLAQLLEQLSAKSDDVKVQAIRALATWEAVEAMPKLIELTTSGTKPVAAAAREALDRLNAPKKD